MLLKYWKRFINGAWSCTGGLTRDEDFLKFTQWYTGKIGIKHHFHCNTWIQLVKAEKQSWQCIWITDIHSSLSLRIGCIIFFLNGLNQWSSILACKHLLESNCSINNHPFHIIYIWETHPIRSWPKKAHREQAQNVLLVLRYMLLFFLIILVVANIISCKCLFPRSTEMRSKSVLNKSKKTYPTATIYEWCFFFLNSICIIGSISISFFFKLFYFPNFPLESDTSVWAWVH